MTTLTRFVLRHAAIGMGAAVVFVIFLLLANVGGIGSLVARTEGGALAAVVMTVFFGITFGSVQVGFALMLRSWDEDGSDGGHRPPLRERIARYLPAPAPRRAPRPAVVHARTAERPSADRTPPVA